TLKYRLEPNFASPPANSDPPITVQVFLPMTTPPAQVPGLVSAGIALSPYLRAADYSSTTARRRVLWIEFDRPPDNPRDRDCTREIAYAPDPVLWGLTTDHKKNAEPPLPVDPEPIRTIVPGQSDDRSGINAMQRLIPSDSPRHFMVPLPSGMADD